MTYDDVSVGAAVSVDARRVLRRAPGALARAAGARAVGALAGAKKPEAMWIAGTSSAASAARRRAMLLQR